jgi:hypothetical protein
MALLWMDSMDLYGADSDTSMQSNGWTSNAWGSVSSNISAGRFGGGAISINRDDWVSIGVNPNGSTIYVQSGLNITNIGQVSNSWYPILLLFANGGEDLVASLKVTPSGALRVFDANNTEVYLSDSRIIFSNIWHFLEVKCVVGNSGTLIVKIDGETVVSLSGTIDTQSGSYTKVDRVIIESPYYYITSSYYIYWDDIVIFDDSGAAPLNDFIGDARIHVLLPNADDTQSDWTRNTGSNDYEAIDDPVPGVRDDDTTYISATTATHKSLFEFENLPVTPETIYAVASSVEARKTDGGDKSMRTYVDSGGTLYTGDTWNVSIEYRHWRYIWETDPDTSVAWIKSGVDALKAGVEVVS